MNQLQFVILLAIYITSFAASTIPAMSMNEDIISSSAGGLAAVISSVKENCATTFLLDGPMNSYNMFVRTVEALFEAGIGVLEMETKAPIINTNNTERQLAELITLAQQLRKTSRCLTLVVASEDPAFFTAFVKLSFRQFRSLLVWSTRLVFLSSLPLDRLQGLDDILQKTNSLLYLASSERGILRLAQGPRLVVAAEEYQPHVALVSQSPVVFYGPMVFLLDLLAQSINFTYTFLRPPDGAWGARRPDGTWSGMVGMVFREEAEMGVGPFAMITSRAEKVDYLRYIFLDYLRVMAGRGSLEVDPWNFALPLGPMVWVSIFSCLVVLSLLLVLLSAGLTQESQVVREQLYGLYDFIRILLQQPAIKRGGWWWERVMMGVWMMTALVLTKSYAGNLMALLAVRHIPQPYQSLGDVLDQPSAAMIWEANSVYSQYLFAAESGVFREVAETVKLGRVIFQRTTDFPRSVDTKVRGGGQVLVIEDLSEKVFMAQDFTKTGRCDFYSSREAYLPFIFAMITRKHSPLVLAINARMRGVTESGLYQHWLQSAIPNSTTCSTAPSTITVTSVLSLTNVAGMVAVLGAGSVVSLNVFVVELLIARLC